MGIPASLELALSFFEAVCDRTVDPRRPIEERALSATAEGIHLPLEEAFRGL